MVEESQEIAVSRANAIAEKLGAELSMQDPSRSFTWTPFSAVSDDPSLLRASFSASIEDNSMYVFVMETVELRVHEILRLEWDALLAEIRPRMLKAAERMRRMLTSVTCCPFASCSMVVL